MKRIFSMLALLVLAGQAAAGNYVGDYNLGDTVDCNFGTVRPSTGASFTLAGSPVISAYVDNSTTEITAGITLTADFDSRTGMNHVRVVASGGNGYSAGTFVELVITTGTVDSISVVGQPVCSFSLSKVSALRPATAGRTLVVDASGLADANAVKVGPTGSGTAQTARDLGASVLISSGTGTGQLSVTSGVIAANTTQFGGSAGTFASGRPEVNATHLAGSSLATLTGAYPSLGIIDSGTAQAATATTLQLRSAASFDADSELVGATCVINTATTGAGQARAITAYTNSTDTATVATWTTTPTGTITYVCFGTAASSGGGGGLDAAATRAALGMASANLDTQLAALQSDTDNLQTRVPTSLVSGRIDASVGAYQSGLTPLQPTTAGRTLDVSTGGEAGIDWANIGSPTTSQTLSGTTISSSQVAASVTGAVGSVTGSVGSVASGGITASSFAADSITAAKVASDVGAEFADATWDEARSGHTTAGTFGFYLDSAISGVSTGGVSAGTIADAVWDELASDHVVSGSTGERIGRVPNAAAGGSGGLPTVDASNRVTALLSSGTGAGQISLSSGAVTVGTNSDKTGYSLASTGLNSVLCTEPSAKPVWSSTSVLGFVCWQASFSVNKVKQTSSTKTLRNDADNANIATCPVSDDGTTFTLGECSP